MEVTGITLGASLITGGSADVGIVFVIDTIGSMGDDIAAVQANVTTIANTIQECSGTVRYALVTYQDHPMEGGGDEDYPSRLELDFTDDGDEVPDEFDNCPDIANPDRQDLDADGVGDACQNPNDFPITLGDGVTIGEIATAP